MGCSIRHFSEIQFDKNVHLPGKKLFKAVEGYLALDNKIVHVNNYKKANRELYIDKIYERKCNPFVFALKILSFATLFFPLLAICLRSHFRKKYHFIDLTEKKNSSTENHNSSTAIRKTPAKQQTTKTEAITVPTNTTQRYQGSNAEFIVFANDRHAISDKEYRQNIWPLLKQRFPHTQLNQDLVDDATIRQKLANQGYETFSIPKSLYELYYVKYNIEDRSSAGLRQCDLLEDGSKNKTVLLINDPLSPSGRKNKIQRTQHYAYYSQPDNKGGIAVHNPKIDCSLIDRSSMQPKEQIYGLFADRENDKKYQKVLSNLNNRIYADLQKNHLASDNNSWKDMRTHVETIFNEINTIITNPASKKSAGDDLYAIFDHLNKENFIAALWHEWKQPANVYTIYRSGVKDIDSPEKNGIPHSLSYTHSFLEGTQYDLERGSCVGLMNQENTGFKLYAIDIDIDDYNSQNGTANKFFFIPPAKGLNRIAEKGEVGHIRSKMFFNPVNGSKISGILDSWGKESQLAFLQADKSAFDNKGQFIDLFKKYVANHSTNIVG